MRLGLIADIHGNAAALAHALDLLRDADRVIAAGDMVHHYRFSNETVALLRAADALAIRGNHEKLLLSTYGQRLRASGSVDPDHLAFIRGLPDRLVLSDDSRRVAVFHGAPWDEPDSLQCEYVYPGQAAKLARVASVGCDVVVLGHTHLPMVQRVDGVTVINPGSCGMPQADEPFSCALLDVTSGDIELRPFRLNTVV